MSSKIKNQELWQKETTKCVKCGLCRSVCPIFEKLNHESVVARGKVSLITEMLNDKQELTPRMKEILSLCLVCKTCTANCPGGVPIDELVIRARTLFENESVSVPKRLAFSVVKNHRLMNTLMRFGGQFQSLGFRKDEQRGGMYPRFPIGIAKRRLLTKLAGKPFTSIAFPRIEGKMKVAFFTGCMVNHIYHDIGKSVIKLLNSANIDVIIPKEQACCGTPMETSGDRVTAAMLAKHNIEQFSKENVDAIVTACASCGCTLKKQYVHLAEDYAPELVEKAKELSEKVYDITEFYLKFIKDDVKPTIPLNKKVTYHDPCHLVRGQGISKEPREVLKSIPGVEYIEASGASKCCGSGGSFCLIHYDLSTQINDDKIADIQKTDADILVTGCPACMMHINDGLARNNSRVKVMHTVQLLADSACEVDQKK